jgi:small-conductance mechanosensitive channel
VDVGLKRILIPFIVALVSSAVLLGVRSVVFGLLRRWGGKAATGMDETVITALRNPSFFWCIAIGLYGGVAVSDLPERYVFYFSRAINVLVLLSVTFAAAGLSGKMFDHVVRRSNLPIPSTGLAAGIVKGTIFVIGILIILGVLGISVAPLITALGIGGLAVALALKDTLENLFAGVHILMEKSVRVGDFIRLENGQEGYIEDITWRTARIRMVANNMVVIPNSKLAQSVVTNYSLPDKSMTLYLQVPVSFDTDIDKVEALLIEEAGKAAGDVAGLLREPGPQVNFIPGFGENGLNLTLVCRIRDVADQFAVQSALRKRILKRFREEGVEMPSLPRYLYEKKEESPERRTP